MARIHLLADSTRTILLDALMPMFRDALIDQTGSFPGREYILTSYDESGDPEILELTRDFNPRQATKEWADRKLQRDYGYLAYWPGSEWHAPAPLAIR